MGIRPKILIAFILCFGLMAIISLHLLEHSVNKSYETIERREMIGRIGRVLQSVESALDSLNSQTRDWAEWTDMYDYALAPDEKARWVKESMAPESLNSGDLSAVWVFNSDWKLLNKVEPKNIGQTIHLPQAVQQDYANAFKTTSGRRNCGVLLTNQGLLALCWARITRTDMSGDAAGTIIMGRLLEPARLEKLRSLADLPFDLAVTQEMPENLTLWANALTPSSLGGTDFWTDNDASFYHLYYPVQDILQEHVGLISLTVPREVHAQGVSLYLQVREQLLWGAFGMALLLGFLLHGLLVSRLRTFTHQLLALTKTSSWNSRISVSGRDELGLLASEVNKMLGLIESQMNSLTALSMTDALTSLPNRRAFDARLALELARERREPRRLALLMLDVDFFKRYNDRYGHPAGDATLQAVGEVLHRACLRAADLPARIGGEEFAVLLPETNARGAMEIAQRVRQLLSECNIAHEDSAVAARVTVSIGIALARKESAEEFMARADKALYHAKEEGHDRACCDEA